MSFSAHLAGPGTRRGHAGRRSCLGRSRGRSRPGCGFSASRPEDDTRPGEARHHELGAAERPRTRAQRGGDLFSEHGSAVKRLRGGSGEVLVAAPAAASRPRRAICRRSGGYWSNRCDHFVFLGRSRAQAWPRGPAAASGRAGVEGGSGRRAFTADVRRSAGRALGWGQRPKLQPGRACGCAGKLRARCPRDEERAGTLGCGTA